MNVAIVVVNYRTPELVEKCLASVRASGRSLALETVIVDNDSRDGSVERLRASQPDAAVVAMPANAGFAAGVNAGFRHTSADLVVVLNPDTELRAQALPALAGHMIEHPRTGVLAPLVEGPDGHVAPNGYRRFPGLGLLALDLCVPVGYAFSLLPGAARFHPYAMSPRALLAGAQPAHVSGAVMAIRRTAYEQAGPLDEGFFLYLEETEWQRRVAARGWAIEVLSDARAIHLVRGGGEAAHAHSPHFLTSALRYLRLQGVPERRARIVLSLSLSLSWLTLQTIALLPGKRSRARSQAQVYGQLLLTAVGAGHPAEGDLDRSEERDAAAA